MAVIVCVLFAICILEFGTLIIWTGLTWFDTILGIEVIGIGVWGGNAPKPIVLPCIKFGVCWSNLLPIIICCWWFAKSVPSKSRLCREAASRTPPVKCWDSNSLASGNPFKDSVPSKYRSCDCLKWSRWLELHLSIGYFLTFYQLLIISYNPAVYHEHLPLGIPPKQATNNHKY